MLTWALPTAYPLFPCSQFFTCLVILFACEVAAGIWGFVNKDQVSLRGALPRSLVMGHLSPWLSGRALWTLLGRCLEGRSSALWKSQSSEHRALPLGRSLLYVSVPFPQIAKDVKQFYDQALQQAVVDDDANNAKAVVKTFHETVWLAGLGQQGWATGPRWGGVGCAFLEESCLSPDLRICLW